MRERACVRACGCAGTLACTRVRVGLLTQHEKRVCRIMFSSETLLIPRRIKRDIVINVKTPSCNVHVFLMTF
jgi:hypothetical protein